MNKKTLILLIIILFYSIESPATQITYPPLTPKVWNNIGEPAQEQFKKDAIVLFHTLFPPQEVLNSAKLSQEEREHNLQSRIFFKRLIIILAFKGLEFTPEMNGSNLRPYPHNIASIFGHGGRIMITLENVSKAKNFLNYLATGDFFKQTTLLKTRKAATHSLRYSRTEDRHIEEKLKNIARNLYYGLITHQHLGIDFALGGIGNKLNGNTIWAKGLQLDNQGQPTKLYLGHLYIFRKDEKKPLPDGRRISGLLIGLEASGPGKKNAWGEAHTAASGMQDSSKLRGVFGGNKWGLLEGIEKPHLYGGKVLKLNLRDIYEADHYIESILDLPEEEQKKYFWWFLNNTSEDSQPIFNR